MSKLANKYRPSSLVEYNMRIFTFSLIASLTLMFILASGCSNPRPTTTSTNSLATTGIVASTSTQVPYENALPLIVVAPISSTNDPTKDYQPPPLKSPLQYVIIKDSLTFGDAKPGTSLPFGSIIYHWRNNITEVIGPDNSLLFICKDADATKIATPGGGGLRPVTKIIQVPNGAMISPDQNNKNITKIYNGNDLIGTIVDKPEDFPYAPTQLLDTSQQYLATAFYADGSTENFTSQVTWNSSNLTVATISSDGLVTALANGTTNITATSQGVTSLPVKLTVHSLVSISISTWHGAGSPIPFNSLSIGSSRKVYATGTYSDGLTFDITSVVTWISSDKTVATVDSNGLITGISNGSDNVTAFLSGISSPTISFKVVPST